VFAILLVTAALAYLFLSPEHLRRFETERAKFILCTILALYLGIFFFVLYPQRVVFESSKILDFATRLTGPVALMVFLLALFLKMMPPYSFARPFVLDIRAPKDASSSMRVPPEFLSLHDMSPAFRHTKMVGDDGNVVGLLVEFPAEVSKVSAKLKIDGVRDESIEFDRETAESRLVVHTTSK
jgi:hypothetical protein